MQTGEIVIYKGKEGKLAIKKDARESWKELRAKNTFLGSLAK